MRGAGADFTADYLVGEDAVRSYEFALSYAPASSTKRGVKQKSRQISIIRTASAVGGVPNNLIGQSTRSRLYGVTG